MIKRTISEKILHYARQYPVVTLTGPRQSGKTTLAKALFPKKKYFSLENIDIRDYAKTDPRSFFVRPHHANFGKRLIKAPKLYFTDCDLAAYLLDIQNAKHIVNHPLKGALFENFAVAELLKARTNQGKNSNIYFFRDNIGNEVDILLENGASVKPVEIKLGSTINDDYFKGLRYYQKINQKNAGKPALIYGGNEDQPRGAFDIFSYRNLEKINL